jgi:hypothetical protein
MKTVTRKLSTPEGRAYWQSLEKLADERGVTLKTTAKVPDTEYSLPFLQGMLDAMGLSWFKYGAVADAYPSKVDALASLRKRLDRYLETGNTEYLIDVANFAMIEFLRPRHPAAHFTPEDSSASPGRVWQNGHVGETSNTTDRENTRRGGSSRTTAGGFYRHEGD